MLDNKQKNKFIEYLLYITCFVTILSQLPAIIDRGLSSPLSIGVWMLLMFFVIFAVRERGITTPKEFLIIIVEVVLLLLFRLLRTFIEDGELYINIERNILLAVFILLVGYFAGCIIDRKILDRFLTIYVWATVIVSAVLFVTVLFPSNFSDVIYAYGSKNSIGQIVLSAIILILTKKLTSGNIIWRLIYGVAALFMTYCLILMKARASIIMIPIIILVLLSKLNVNKKLRNFMIAVVILTVIVIIFNQTLYQSLVIDLFFRGDASMDLDIASSGRFSHWLIFGEEFAKYPVFGKGPRQYESLIITSYLENGIIFGTVILHIALFPIIWCIKHLNRKDAMFSTVLLLSICYIGNGLFEQYAPFGPGVKCFLLWFIIGCLVGIRTHETENREVA